VLRPTKNGTKNVLVLVLAYPSKAKCKSGLESTELLAKNREISSLLHHKQASMERKSKEY